jgi:hypothetical protein
MRTRTFISVFGLFYAASLTPVLAQETPPGPPTDPNKTYSPVAKYSLNDLLKYKMGMKMLVSTKNDKGESPMPDQEMEMATTTKLKTVKVRDDGSAVLMSTTEGGTMTSMGTKAPIPATPPIKMEINKFGIAKMSGMENLQGGAAISKMFDFNNMPSMGILFPDHPVKVGESWENLLPNPMGGDEKLKIVSTLLGVEMLGGRETLKIKQTMAMPMKLAFGQGGVTKDETNAMMVMKGIVNSNGIMNIIEETGRLVKSIGTIQGNVAMEMKGEAAKQSPFGPKMNMKMDGSITMELLSEGKVSPPEPTVTKPVVQPTKPVKPKK